MIGRMKRLWGIGLVFLASCLPIPQLKTELELPEPSYRSSPLTVQADYITVPGFDEPHTPAQYNQSYYLRYFRPEDTPETVLILVPGIFGGATSVDALARQLVASRAGLEVWAVDRRANALEDREVITQSLRSRDPAPAYRYYVENIGTPEGFNRHRSKDLSFMGYWGLEVHLRDLHEVVLSARGHAPRVVLGGHSLGAGIVGFYAAFDFGETQTDPGHAYIDAMILIDGALGRSGGFGIDAEMTKLLGVLPDKEGLEAGIDPPFLTFGLDPLFQARREAAALLARFQPGKLSPGTFRSFPATNRAVLGLMQDDTYGPFTIFTSSLGKAFGAKVGGNLGAFLSGGRLGRSSATVIGVADGYSYVDWVGDPETDASSIASLARSWSRPETNRAEWYFPLRLALDIGELDGRLKNEAGFVAGHMVLTPTLVVGAGRGLVRSLESAAAYGNTRPGSLFSSYILPTMTHLDIVEADHNPLVTLIDMWLEQLARLSVTD